MKGVLIGAMHKKGCFSDDNGNKLEYNNLVLLLQKPIENVKLDDRTCEGIGFDVVEAKCPYENLSYIFDGADIHKISELENFIGCEVNYFFNEKKKLDTVIL